MPSHHEAAVSAISATVRSFFSRREAFRIFHGSSNSTRPSHGSKVVDISALKNVLRVDKASATAVVEPNVPMDKLVQATLAHGMIPPVVMEFPGITVGGGFAGSAGESSSFRYGYFDETIRSVEMVLATGDVINASKSENPELFKGAAGTMGTLGITTKLEVQLLPARRYVKLVYQPYSTVQDTVRATREATQDPENDYVDAIIFSKTHGVLMTGKLTDEIPSSTQPQTFSRAWDPWFYMHAQKKPSTQPSVDYIPLAEYLFRYDRGGFWVGTEAFRYFRPLAPFNRITRWLLDDFMHTRSLFRALHGSNMSFGHIVQDLSLPYDTAERFIDWTADELAIWPLWLCPLREISRPSFHPSTVDADAGRPAPMLNVGLWGRAKGAGDFDTFVQHNRALEAELTRLGGRKVLYSHTYYTEAEFWDLYDRAWYDGLRERYSATSLPTVYDKVRVDVEKKRQASKRERLATSWPFGGLIGVWSAMRSREYKIHRQPSWTYWNVEKELALEGGESKKTI